MGLFRYEAVDRAGKVVHGAMKASDEQQVANSLAQKGYALRAIHSADGQLKTTSRPAAAAPKPTPVQSAGGMSSVTLASGVPVSIKSTVPASTLARFFRHLSTLVKSGVPINQALVEMAQVVQHRRLVRALPRIHEHTQGGRSLSGAMAEHPGVFPVHTIASVWAGELAGKLEIALDEVATGLEAEASDTRRGRIGWGLVKINWIMFVMLIPAANLVALLSPALTKTLKRGGDVTRAEVLQFIWQTFVHDMLWKSLLVAAALIGFWIALGFVKRVPTVRRLLDELLIRMPIWGGLHRDRAIARFAHVLDSLYSAGISPGAAWDAASLVPRNSYIAEKLRLARRHLPSNAGIGEMFASSGIFDNDDIAMVASGEKAGSVPQVLADMSAVYANRAEARASAAKAIAGTTLTVSLLLLGGYIIVKVASSYFDFAFKAADIVGQ